MNPLQLLQVRVHLIESRYPPVKSARPVRIPFRLPPIFCQLTLRADAVDVALLFHLAISQHRPVFLSRRKLRHRAIRIRQRWGT